MTVGGSPRYVMTGNTTKAIVIGNSLVDGGSYGVSFAAAQVVITDTIIRNMRFTGLSVGQGDLQMVRGEISNNGTGVEGASVGNLFTNVTFNGRNGTGIVVYWFGEGNAKLVMRGCTVNATIQLENRAVADLGNSSSAGNNTLRADPGVALDITGGDGPPVDAVGNTWRPVQEANSEGRYPPGKMVTGPEPAATRANYAIGGKRVLNL